MTPPATTGRRPAAEDDDDARDRAAAAEFAAALEAFERSHPAPKARQERGERAAPALRPGSRVAGRVVAVSADTVLVDVGGRSEGVADASEFLNEDGTLSVEVGQTLQWVVLVTGEPLQLSRGLRAPKGPSLAGLKQARESGLPVQDRVTAVNKGGLEVELGGVRGFCPLSQMDDGYVEDASAFVGRTLEFVVTEVDEARARVVVSRRRLLQERKDSQRRERMAALAVGQELEGRVTRIEPFGAFVDLGGVDGLVHVSEIAATRVRHPRDVLAPGETVRVRVLRIEPEKRRIALSIRRVYEEG